MDNFIKKIMISFLKAVFLLLGVSLFVSSNIKGSTFNSVVMIVLFMIAVWDWEYK